jgi:hypothetical protein
MLAEHQELRKGGQASRLWIEGWRTILQNGSCHDKQGCVILLGGFLSNVLYQLTLKMWHDTYCKGFQPFVLKTYFSFYQMPKMPLL